MASLLNMAFSLRGVAPLVMLVASLVSLSCGGGGPQLTRIAILPQNITVAGTPTIIYTAVGHYQGTQTTKDISTQVTWLTSTPSIVAFSDPSHPNYLIPTGSGCGANLGVQAVIYNDPRNPSAGTAVIGSATLNVQCGTGSAVDFGLSSNPNSVTVSAGSTATYTISVLAISGNPTVSLHVTGLPSGAIANFNPPSVTGTSFSTLTISTAPTTLQGTYHPKITGSDASGSLSAGVSLTIT